MPRKATRRKPELRMSPGDESTEAKLARFDKIRWGLACREMLTRLANGNLEAAHEVLNRFAHASQPGWADMNTPVTMVFPAKLATLLDSKGYRNMNALHWATNEELLRIPNLGEKALDLIRETVSRVMRNQCIAIPTDEELDKLAEEEACE